MGQTCSEEGMGRMGKKERDALGGTGMGLGVLARDWGYLGVLGCKWGPWGGTDIFWERTGSMGMRLGSLGRDWRQQDWWYWDGTEMCLGGTEMHWVGTGMGLRSLGREVG